MKKKRRKGIKGLIFLFVLVCLIAIYLIWKLTLDNMTVNVTAYYNSQPLPNAFVSIGDEKAVTMEDGSAKLRLRVSQGDTLLVAVQRNNLKLTDTIVIDEDRYLTTHTNCDIVFKDD